MANTYTFNSLNQSYLSILTSVELVSQISLSVSVCRFVCFSVCSTIFWEWLNIFFWNFAYGSLRGCWGSLKHLRNLHLSPTPDKGSILGYFCPFLWGFLCSSLSWEWFNIFSWNFVEIFLVLIWWSLNTKKSLHSSLCWGLFWVIFGLILMFVPIFLENCSIFSCEILYRCSWYSTLKFFMSCVPGAHSTVCSSISREPFHVFSWNFVYADVCGRTLTVTTLKCFIHIIYFSAGGHFGVFLDSLYVPPILENHSIFSYEILYRCFLYNSDSHYTKKVFHIISVSAGDHFGVFWGPIWDIFGAISKTLSWTLYICSWVIPHQMVKIFWGLDMTHLSI